MKSIFYRYGKRRMLIFMVLLLASTSITLAQIKLVDNDTKNPIEGAVYQYGNQSGVTRTDGIIEINLIESISIIISHLSYGNWELSPEEVKNALKEGQYLLVEKVVIVQPVTIIALRPSSHDTESLELGDQDRLAHDGGALLNQTPVISSIRKSGSYGFDPVMRGFKYDQLNVVINGAQSAIAACPNRMDPPTSQIAPNMMDRIEILKGPHSLRYGSAFGGTINFISASPSFSSKGEIYGRATGHYESNGNILRSEGTLGARGSKYDLGIFGSWSEGGDYTDGNGNTVPAEFLRGSFGTELGLKIAANQHLNLFATRNLARDVDFPTLMMDLRTDDTWLFNANHVINFNKKVMNSWTTTAYASIVNHVMDNLTKNLDPRMLNAITDATTHTYGGRTEGTWNYNNGKLYAGADLKIEQAQGTRSREFLMGPNMGNTFYDNVWQDGQITKTGMFTEYHLEKGSLNFVFSGRLEVNSSIINDPANEFTDVNTVTSNTQLNPSLSLGGVNSFDNGFNMGLWLGRAQRSGSLTERFINYFPVGMDPYEVIGNPKLAPEVNNQIDLTFGYKSKGTLVELTLFSSFLQDYISSEIRTDLSPRLPMSPGVRQFINIDNAFIGGFEASWSQILFAGLQHQMSVAYTYGEDKVLIEPLPEIAPLDLRYTLMGSYLKNKLHPELVFRTVIAQDRVSTNFGESATPAFTLVDFNVRYQISKILRAATGIQNLFDEAYYEHLSRNMSGSPINAPGRNIFLSLTLDLM